MLLATILALSSAVLHAGWNLLVKTSDDRDLATMGQFVFVGLLALPLALIVGGPGWEAAPYLVASALVHIVYVLALVKAYEHGDFSLAYPLARGGGAMMAALGGVALLGDYLSSGEWLAIGVVGVGLLSLMSTRASLPSVGWALFTAVTIATYTLIDSKGARQSTSGAAYGLTLMPLFAITIGGAGIARGRGRDFRRSIPGCRLRYLISGACLVTAYTFVLVAVRLAPVGYVTMLRESSVVLAALAGWLFLHERMGRHRLVSSCVILGGLLGLVAAAG